MAERIPLVISDGEIQQLQPKDDLPIPDRVQTLEHQVRLLVEILLQHGIALPDELTNLL